MTGFNTLDERGGWKNNLFVDSRKANRHLRGLGPVCRADWKRTSVMAPIDTGWHVEYHVARVEDLLPLYHAA